MEYDYLGASDIKVSKICLGSMTWGEQNSETESHQQLDLALDRGVNFIDTAEMYSVPSREPTCGASETIIGNWLAKHGARDRVVIATKVVGPAASWMPYIRQANTHLDRANIHSALDGSLKRLQTEYIDLYQVHWPERDTNYFGKLGYEPTGREPEVSLEETLQALDDCVRSGKVRAIGVSNETPWGVMRYLHLSESLGISRIVSVQNPYSLLNRTFDVGLAEIALQEKVGLLAYSPLGFGVLTGKYLDGARPAGARLTLFDQFKRYQSQQARTATAEYAQIASRHGLSLPQMALSYVNSRCFLTSTIIGATNLEQLAEDIDSIELRLAEEVLADIERVHNANPNPAP